MRYPPSYIRRVFIALLAGWSTATGSAAQEKRVSLPEVMPSLTFLRRENPPYRNFAFDRFGNYKHHTIPQSESLRDAYKPVYYYDGLGNFLFNGFRLYDWSEQRREGQEWGSFISKDEASWTEVFNYIAIGQDGYGKWNYSAMVGDGLVARFSPLTLSRVDFNGLRLDVSTPQVKFTALGSRIERPYYIKDSGDDVYALWHFQNFQFADASTLILGGRLQGEAGALRLGLNGANMHVYQSTQPGNSIKGVLRSEQPFWDRILVRFSDDSPGDGGGAVVQEVQLIVNGQARPDLRPRVVRHRAGIRPQVGSYSQATGGFISKPYTTPPTINLPFYRGRNEIPLFADYFYRLDHEDGVDVSKNTILDGLLANIAVESPEGTLHADGEEQVVYIFDIGQESYVESLELEAVVGNDYRVEVATLEHFNPRGKGHEVQYRSRFYRTVLRAPGQVQDLSNLKRVRAELGESTAIFTYSADLNLQLVGVEINGEYARSALYRRYPAHSQMEPVFARSPRFSDAGSAYFINATRWWKRLRLGAEYFAMNPDFTTTMSHYILKDPGVGVRRSNISRLTNETIYWDLVQDNEDGDGFPDKRIGFVIGSIYRDDTDTDADGVHLGQDENNDGFPDINRDGDALPDYLEPFLMYDVEPNDYVYGLDRNHNDEPDQREDDRDPDYPYDQDQRGFHLFAQMDLSRHWSLGAGRYAVEEIAGSGQNRSAYALLSYRREGVSRLRRIFFENHFRRVQDSIPDEYTVLTQERRFVGIYHYFVHNRYWGNRAFQNRLRTDPLRYRDSYVEEAYLEARLRPWSSLHLVQKLRLRLNWQQGGHLSQGLSGGTRRLDYWSTVSRADYTWRLGRLRVQPKFKFMLLRYVDQGIDRLMRLEYDLIPIVDFNYELMSRTALRLGAQGWGPLPYRFTDRARKLESFERRTITATVTNLSRYFGYDLYTIVGVNRDDMEFDTRFREAENFDVVSFFVRVLIGFPGAGDRLF